VSVQVTGLEAAKRDLQQKADRFYQALVLDTVRRIILRSPVDTGRFRGNWRLSTATPDTTVNGDVDPTGAGLLARAQRFVLRLRLADDAIIANSLPYAATIEYGGYPNPSKGTKTVGGFSRQAPAGVVGVTVAEVQPLAAKLANEVSRDAQAISTLGGSPS
jgi:hypothetical protein